MLLPVKRQILTCFSNWKARLETTFADWCSGLGLKCSQAERLFISHNDWTNSVYFFSYAVTLQTIWRFLFKLRNLSHLPRIYSF